MGVSSDYIIIVKSDLIKQPRKFQNVFYRFIYIFYVSDAVIKNDQYAF